MALQSARGDPLAGLSTEYGAARAMIDGCYVLELRVGLGNDCEG